MNGSARSRSRGGQGIWRLTNRSGSRRKRPAIPSRTHTACERGGTRFAQPPMSSRVPHATSARGAVTALATDDRTPPWPAAAPAPPRWLGQPLQIRPGMHPCHGGTSFAASRPNNGAGFVGEDLSHPTPGRRQMINRARTGTMSRLHPTPTPGTSLAW